MSNYKFKGTSISSITNTTGGVNTSIGPYYSGFPATLATDYTMMRPLSLNYTIPPTSTDVSNYCTASCTDITNSQTVTVPTGVKKFRYLILGGGGSGGGMEEMQKETKATVQDHLTEMVEMVVQEAILYIL